MFLNIYLEVKLLALNAYAFLAFNIYDQIALQSGYFSAYCQQSLVRISSLLEKKYWKKNLQNSEQKTRSSRKERKYVGTKVNSWVLTSKVLSARITGSNNRRQKNLKKKLNGRQNLNTILLLCQFTSGIIIGYKNFSVPLLFP